MYNRVVVEADVKFDSADVFLWILSLTVSIWDKGLPPTATKEALTTPLFLVVFLIQVPYGVQIYPVKYMLIPAPVFTIHMARIDFYQPLFYDIVAFLYFGVLFPKVKKGMDFLNYTLERK